MKIAFITNYEKTIYFHRVATRLEAEGHEVSWISPSAHWADWLAGNGVSRDRILDLTRNAGEWRNGRAAPEDLAALTALEARAGLRVRDLILMDRILREKPAGRVVAYLAVAARELAAFLAGRKVAVVFGEQTFAIEILAGLVARDVGGELLVPHPVRIPSRRLGFFRGHLQAELVRIRDITEADRRQATEFLGEYREKKPRPEYFYRNNRTPAPRADWPRKLVKHVRLALEDPHDETHFSPVWLVRKRVSVVVNAAVQRETNPFVVPALPPARPFVLYALHKQPEASIDVLGSAFSNQLELVRTMARTLPLTHDLWVKEHSNAVGDRTWSYMRELRRIPGVTLVDPWVDTFAVMEAADLVVSISGTVAYEAALLGKRAATVSPMFFGPLLVASGFDPVARGLSELLGERFRAGRDQAVEFIAGVLAGSFPGTIDNPNFSPGCLAPDNIASVAAGFSAYLDRGAAPASLG